MQVEHKTEKGTVLFVKVPDGSYNFTIGISKVYFKVNESSNHIKIDPSGNWQLIGLTSEVTEEQTKNMVDDEIDWGHKTGYVYYTNRSTVCGLSALDSFKALMQQLNVYEANPYKKHFKDKLTGENKVRIDWQQAESRTGKWVVLFKPNEK